MSHSPNDRDNSASGFVGRWSRRKLQDKEAVAGPEIALPPLPGEAEESALQPTMPPVLEDRQVLEDEQVPVDQPVALTDADMPPLESLDANSDYSPFFSEGVSKQLRNLALKKLFFSGKFASRDGLDDYDDDFTRFEPLGDTITSDMKFHERRKEKARLAKLQEEEEQRLAAEQEVEDDAGAESTDTESDAPQDEAPQQSEPASDDGDTTEPDAIYVAGQTGSAAAGVDGGDTTDPANKGGEA